MTGRFIGFACLLLAFVFIVPVPAMAQTEAPTDDECAMFGQQIASWLTKHDLTTFEQSLDSQALVDRMMAGIDLPEKAASDFRTGVMNGIKTNLERGFGNVQKAQFLRVIQRPGGKRAIVRVNLKIGINYFEFICARQATGELKWIDVFVYSTGDTLSNTLRDVVLPAIAEMQKGLMERLAGSESNYIKHLPEIEDAMNLLRDGKPAEAESLLKALPVEMQTDRIVLMARCRVEQTVNQNEYLNVIREWEKTYPNDPALALISIDSDLLRKDFAGAIAHVDRLDRMVGGDPYQNFIRGNIYFAAKNYAMAKQAENAALQADPHLASAYDVLLNISLAEEDYDGTAAILERVEHTYPHADMAKAMKSRPAYAKFMLSPAYAKWIGQRSDVTNSESGLKP
jgi:hypothetical protein